MSEKYYFESPIGKMELAIEENKILSLEFTKDSSKKYKNTGPANEVFTRCSQQLKEYFDGTRRTFSLPVCINGTTFQNSVWGELVKIPLGTTISYGELALRIGNPKAVRAVGMANGQNPIAIVVPCHRVIGKNGTLTGYGGGLWRKKWLLEHEAAMTGVGLFKE